MTQAPWLSVVVATYQRPQLLTRLLRQLAEQTLPAHEFEVVVVDDGSRVPAAAAIRELRLPYALQLLEQPNAGAAAARHRGILAARGEALVITDDDMQLGPTFLAEHARWHRDGGRVAVLGRIVADPAIARMPLFERWHQRMLDLLDHHLRQGTRVPRGMYLFTGNASFRRADYLAVGGFDRALGHSEDAELGLRLERSGVRFLYAPNAVALHGSDHTSAQKWRTRARAYGRYDLRVARKHPTAADADPWRFLFELPIALAPAVGLAVAAPTPSGALAGASYFCAEQLDRLGLGRAALRAATATYALDYFRGLSEESGSARRAFADLARYVRGRVQRRVEPFRSGLSALRADHQAMRRSEGHYGHRAPSRGALPEDLVNRIGLQILAGYRLMRALHEADFPLGARVVSRLVRHAYAADIHWEAELAPGVVIVHGMGLAVSHAARVGPGCILFQNVTLGMGSDRDTDAVGAPRLGAGVHVGPGATLIGPISVGSASKVAPNSLVTHSVPPGSLVGGARAPVQPRVRVESSVESEEVSA